MRDDSLRQEIGRKFAEAINALRISKARAARDLGVSRQMLYEYLNGKSLPDHTKLERACTAWNLELNYKTVTVTAKSFPKPSGPPLRPTEQLKLDLQEAIQNLRDEDLHVRILRKDNGRVELRVDLRFGAEK